MQAPVTVSVRSVTADDVVGPFMPDRMPVFEYAAHVILNLVDLVGTTVRILPGVDTNLLSPLVVPTELATAT